MPGELKADAALTAQKETMRVMKSALDTIAASLDTRLQQHKTFCFLLDTETLMTADAIDLDDLQRKCTDFATAFPDDVDGARFVDEIQNCRILASRRVGVDVSPLGILKFTVSFGGNDVFRDTGLVKTAAITGSRPGISGFQSLMRNADNALRSLMQRATGDCRRCLGPQTPNFRLLADACFSLKGN